MMHAMNENIRKFIFLLQFTKLHLFFKMAEICFAAKKLSQDICYMSYSYIHQSHEQTSIRTLMS